MATEKVTGIVTDVIKHSDKHNVVTLFARDQGRISLLSAAGTGKSARMRNAALVPLTVISADITFNSARELSFLGKFSREYLWKDIYFNPVKRAIAMFMSEFINAYTRQSPPDPRLWDFIVDSIRTLDTSRAGFSNAHLAFLIEFLDYSGVRPDLSEWRDDAWFDMRYGTMSILPPSHRDVIGPPKVSLLPTLARMNRRTARLFRMSATDRRELLRMLLHYYSLHFPGISNLKSPAILAEIFQ